MRIMRVLLLCLFLVSCGQVKDISPIKDSEDVKIFVEIERCKVTFFKRQCIEELQDRIVYTGAEWE